jgi:hypothetical protein
LCVDGKEAQLVFIDHAHTDMSVRNMGQKKERERGGDRWRGGQTERQREREAGSQRTGRWRDRHVGKKYGSKEREVGRQMESGRDCVMERVCDREMEKQRYVEIKR